MLTKELMWTVLLNESPKQPLMIDINDLSNMLLKEICNNPIHCNTRLSPNVLILASFQTTEHWRAFKFLINISEMLKTKRLLTCKLAVGFSY